MMKSVTREDVPVQQCAQSGMGVQDPQSMLFVYLLIKTIKIYLNGSFPLHNSNMIV